MNLAIPFKLYYELNDVATEFNIEYDPEKNDIDKLGDFLETFPDKRINIHIVNGVTKKDVKAIKRQGTNFALRLGKDDLGNVEMLQDLGVRFFFDRDVVAYNRISLSYYISLGVSDVYLADDLWYSLKDTYDRCNKSGVKVRAILNRIPMMWPNRGNDARAMIFRPEDFDLYSPFVDVAEFDCWDEDGKVYNFSKSSVLFRTYFEKRRWCGDLGEINSDIFMPVPNEALLPEFTKNKLSCGLRCMDGGSCKKCRGLLDIAYSMDKKDWKFKKKS